MKCSTLCDCWKVCSSECSSLLSLFPLPTEPTSYSVEVPNLDPFEEPEKEYHLQLRRGSSFSSMASSEIGRASCREIV